MNIKEYYLENYPEDCNSDGLGGDINQNSTFAGLLNVLFTEGDVYEYIGVSDSIVRERLFEGLAKELEVGYDYVYKLWLK